MTQVQLFKQKRRLHIWRLPHTPTRTKRRLIGVRVESSRIIYTFARQVNIQRPRLALSNRLCLQMGLKNVQYVCTVFINLSPRFPGRSSMSVFLRRQRGEQPRQASKVSYLNCLLKAMGRKGSKLWAYSTFQLGISRRKFWGNNRK